MKHVLLWISLIVTLVFIYFVQIDQNECLGHPFCVRKVARSTELSAELDSVN